MGSLENERSGPYEAIANGIVSNGRYTAWITPEGTGASFWGGYALTPWTMATRSISEGILFHLRDRATGAAWILGQPLLGGRSARSAERSPGCYRIRQTAHGITAELAICVHPERDVEVRSVRLRNDENRRREIEIASYAEIALNRPAAHRAHPIFSKLFIETEALAPHGLLLARRRPRGADESHPWLVHAAMGPGEAETETDRARFIGRTGTPVSPAVLASGAPLSGAAGPVLDPIFCVRRLLTIAPGEEVRLDFALGVGGSRDDAIALARRIESCELVDGIFHAAAAAEQRLPASGEIEEHLALAGATLLGTRRLRADASILQEAAGDPRDLGRLGIDLARPLAVIDASGDSGAEALSRWAPVLRTWDAMAVPVETVVLVDERQRLNAGLGESRPGLRILEPRCIGEGLRAVMLAWARTVCAGPPPPIDSTMVAFPPDREVETARHEASGDRLDTETALTVLDNGYGGFTPDGTGYIIRIDPTGAAAPAATPHPWVNAISNERIGLLVSERGSCATWSRNSREFRLTPWSNDPLLDPHGEAFFVRDEETGEHWSAWPGPRPAPVRYEVEHRFGASLCRSTRSGLAVEATIFVPAEDPLQIVRLRVTNRSPRARRVRLFGYRRLAMGDSPEGSGRLIVTSYEAELDSILARNRAAGEHGDAVVFAAVSTAGCADAAGGARRADFTTDAAEFLGPHGDVSRPAALARGVTMTGRVGAGLDACAAQAVAMEIAPGGTAEAAFLFGETGDPAELRALLEQYRSRGAVDDALAAALGSWSELFDRLQISTPDPALDFMVNGWLPYQNLSCRIRGRTAFYQSGGAYGFRDQLQDASAFVGTDPTLVRRQILLHAAHQFAEGDVLHWWHPPTGRGIRTRFADDLLWLPYIASYYLGATGDRAILEESVRFLEGPALAPGEDEIIVLPRESAPGSLYEHCCRAVDRSLRTGAHGLPLFGTGDWNDGMNRVGREGRGESVWMGFFLYAVLGDFLPICRERGDADRAARYHAARERLGEALNLDGWDGDWYRRGFYDNGQPLGSTRSDECKIDALVQAWSVLSGAAPPDRAEKAMEAVERRLISEADGIIRLLDPPFSDTPNDPGYIKGYVPGVRENGGQYTHAALWVVRAFAELGRNDRVAPLLRMLNPATRASTRERADRYLLEPYVVAADVYGTDPHVGRGGWSWYTGSAGWMYRVAVESLLGLRWSGGTHIEISPCIPDGWPGFRATYRPPGRRGRVEIEVRNPNGRARAVTAVTIDGAPGAIQDGRARIPLDLPTETARVTVVLG